MRIAIVNFTSGGMSGGYRKYLHEIVPRLVAACDVSHILLAYPESVDIVGLSRGLEKVECLPYTPGVALRAVKRQVAERLGSFKPDVLFFPSARCFEFGDTPLLVMIRNMEPLTRITGNPLAERLVNLFRRREARKCVRKATRIIAISDFVKRFMMEEWAVEESRIGLVTHGCRLWNDTNLDKPVAVPDSWDGRFLFTAGSIRPARGLEDVLAAMAMLGKHPDLAGLVIAGGVDRWMGRYRRKLERYAAARELADRIVWTGSLGPLDMAWCYEHCLAFVMTSRVEACPNIALEAMAHGCVCVSTDSPPMPEFFSDSAIYYGRGNGRELSEALERAVSLLGTAEREELREKARRRAADFTWDECAGRTVEELKKTAREGR